MPYDPYFIFKKILNLRLTRLLVLKILLSSMSWASAAPPEKGLITPQIRRCVRLLKPRMNAIWPATSLEEQLSGIPVFKNQPYHLLRKKFDPEMGTLIYQSREGLIPANSQAVLPFFHGFGTLNFSHGGSALQALNIFLSWTTHGERGPLAYSIQSDPNFIRAAAFSLDLPGSGAGPLTAAYPSLSITLKWLASMLQDLKRLGIPLIPICRSSSCGLLAQLNLQFPGLLDGMIMTGFTHPDPATGYIASEAMVDEFWRTGEHIPNVDSRNWITRMYSQMDWHKKRNPFGNTPTLILIGENDKETSLTARQWFRKNINKDVQKISGYFEIPDIAHDVFNTDQKDAVLMTYSHIYEFLSRIPKLQQITR